MQIIQLCLSRDRVNLLIWVRLKNDSGKECPPTYNGLIHQVASQLPCTVCESRVCVYEFHTDEITGLKWEPLPLGFCKTSPGPF